VWTREKARFTAVLALCAILMAASTTINLATQVQGLLPVANGGTNASTATAALTSLGAAPTASPTFTGTVTEPVPTLPSQTANNFFAAPNGSAGAPSFRAIASGDVSTVLASPPAIGGTAAAAVSATTLNAGSAKFTVNASGLPTKSNNLTLAGQGYANVQTVVNSTGLTANYNSGTAKTLVTPTVSASVYRISGMQAITTAATTSSTFPSLTLSWTDPGSVARTVTLVSTSSTNATSVQTFFSNTIMTNGSTAVTITSASYASSGTTSMAYELAVILEQLN